MSTTFMYCLLFVPFGLLVVAYVAAVLHVLYALVLQLSNRGGDLAMVLFL